MAVSCEAIQIQAVTAEFPFTGYITAIIRRNGYSLIRYFYSSKGLPYRIMRERLRPDNQSINWVYAAKIVGDIPDIVLETGRKMNQLWNELVWLHDRTPYRLLRSVARCFHDLARDAKRDAGRAREKGDEKKALAHDALAESHLVCAEELKATAGTVKKESYQGFGAINGHKWTAPLVAATITQQRASNQPLLNIPLQFRINHHTQERGNELGLPVWCKWHTGDTFKGAMDAYAKKIRFAPRRKRTDKRGPTSIHIAQRTDSGKGWPLEELCARRKPFSMRPEVENGGRYEGWEAPAWFSINGERVPLRIIMHRPFPAGAIVKRYSLLGHYEGATGAWTWRVLFQLEIPPQRALYSLTNCIIAIDAGWRFLKRDAITDDGIRIMTIWDGYRYIIIELPFDLTNLRERRRLEEEAEEGRIRPRIDIREAWAIQAERDEWLEKCKKVISHWDASAWPEAAVKKLRWLRTMKREEIVEIREILAKVGLTCDPIEDWRAQDLLTWRKQRHIEIRWYKTRDEILRQLAVELAEQCDQVRWEGDLSLKRMAEEGGRKTAKRKETYAETGKWERRTEDERRLEDSQRHRQLANLSRFRTWLREAVEKRGREIIDDDTAYSSQICHLCNGRIESSSDLSVKCTNCGALFDQDENTAQYYWERYDAETREVAVPLASVERSLLKKVWRAVSA